MPPLGGGFLWVPSEPNARGTARHRDEQGFNKAWFGVEGINPKGFPRYWIGISSRFGAERNIIL